MRALVLVAERQKFSKGEQFNGGKHIITFMDDCCVQITGQGEDADVNDVEYAMHDSYTSDGVITFTEDCTCMLVSFPNLGRAINGGLERILQSGQFDFSVLKVSQRSMIIDDGIFEYSY